MDVPMRVYNPVEQRIVDTFNIFDLHGDKMMDVRHIGTLLRFLGCVPSEEDIQAIIKETLQEEDRGEVQLELFLQNVEGKLMDQAMKPASPEKLLAAFRRLDPETRNYLEKDYVAKLWTEVGDPFSPEELKDMMAVAVDPSTGTIPYQFYISQLKHMPKDSIYELALNERAKQAKGAKKKQARASRFIR